MNISTTTAPPVNAFPRFKATEQEKVGVSVMLGIFTVIGTLGNGLVLYVFTKKSDKVSFTYFLLALAWTDLFTCLVTMPFTVEVVRTERYLIYDAACRGYNFLVSSNVPLSVFIMAAIAVDRYFSICRPFLHVVTPRRAKIAILCLSLFAIALGISTAILYRVDGDVVIDETVDPGQASWCPNITQSLFKNFTLDENEQVIINLDGFGHPQNCSRRVVYEDGYCGLDLENFSPTFIVSHEAVYISFHVFAFLLVFILYFLIYRTVVRIRKKRTKQKSSSLAPMKQTPPSVDISNSKSKSTESTTSASPQVIVALVEKSQSGISVENPSTDGQADDEEDPDGPKNKVDVEDGSQPTSKGSSCTRKKSFREPRDFNFLANFRTAAMLFTVIVIFIISFLPCGMMAVGAIDFNVVAFYMYFIHNAANPIIYAFMNQFFREELLRIYQRGKHFFRKD